MIDGLLYSYKCYHLNMANKRVVLMIKRETTPPTSVFISDCLPSVKPGMLFLNESKLDTLSTASLKMLKLRLLPLAVLCIFDATMDGPKKSLFSVKKFIFNK